MEGDCQSGDERKSGETNGIKSYNEAPGVEMPAPQVRTGEGRRVITVGSLDAYHGCDDLCDRALHQHICDAFEIGDNDAAFVNILLTLGLTQVKSEDETEKEETVRIGRK